jgi:hypothetical protein
MLRKHIKVKGLLIVVIALTIGAFGQTARNSTIQGMLIKADGKPSPYTEIELVPVNFNKITGDPRLISTSSTSGKFTFFDVPAGRYTLSINFGVIPTELSPYDTFFYPSAFNRFDAEVIAIEPSTKIRNMVFRLPPALVKKTIYGRVTWEDGAPVENAYICYADINAGRFRTCGPPLTDATGRFKLIGFEHRKYRLGAIVLDRAPGLYNEPKVIAGGESNDFILDSGTGEVEVHVRKSKEAENIMNRYIGFVHLSTGRIHERI